MFSEFTEQLIALVLKGIAGIIAIWLSKKIGSLLNAVETKYDVDIDNTVEASLRLITKRIVLALFQTEVSGLKEKGKFDAAAQKLVLQKAMRSIQEEIQDTILDSSSVTIIEMIESVIAEEKNGNK